MKVVHKNLNNFIKLKNNICDASQFTKIEHWLQSMHSYSLNAIPLRECIALLFIFFIFHNLVYYNV